MDPIFLHLRVNHFPIVLAVVGAVACLLAAVLRRDDVWRYALVTVILAGLSAPAAYWTGRRADDASQNRGLPLDLDAMGAHEETAFWALIALSAAAVAGGLALLRPGTATRTVALVLALAAAGFCGWTGMHAGNIAHGDYTMGR